MRARKAVETGLRLLMAFYVASSPVDLGDLPVENLYIDLYMPMAPGDYVKVYLLGYRYARLGGEGTRFSHQNLANNLNLPLETVLQAWDYWEERHVIEKAPTTPTDDGKGGDERTAGAYNVIFLSLKPLHLRELPSCVQTAPQTEPVRVEKRDAETAEPAPYAAQPDELLAALRDPSLRDLFDNINRLMRRSLVPTEQMEVLQWLQHYQVEPGVITRAFQLATEEREVRSIRYVGGILRNWYDRNLRSLEALNQHLQGRGQRYRLYDRVFQALGFQGRLPTEAEKIYMDKWIDEWRYEEAILVEACHRTVSTSQPSIRYVDGVLARWHAENLRDLEAIRAWEKTRGAKTGKTGKAAPKKTRFHLSNSRGDAYSNEDLEAILLGRGKGRRDDS